MSDLIRVKTVLNSLFKEVQDFSEIHRGVMNFKYQFSSLNKNYVIRCYPKGRDFLASTEFHYIKLFESLGIKVPNVHSFSQEPFPYLIYEKLEGECLGDVFESLDYNAQCMLCNQVNENYKLISEISTSGNGCITGYNIFPNSSWLEFLSSELSKSFHYLSSVYKPFNCKVLSEKMYDILSLKVVNQQNLVWSDFNPDNMIVSKDGILVGFIDFEGLLGGDPLMGIGYLQARNYDSQFYKRFYDCCDLFQYKEIIDFYSVLRYLRLVPYENMLLPNGTKRMIVETFLPNSIKLINNYCYGKSE